MSVRLLLIAVLALTGCTVASASTRPSPQPTVLLDQQGTLNAETPVFQPAGPWTVRWSAKAAPDYNDGCIFTVRLYHATASLEPHPDPKTSAYHVVDARIHYQDSDVDYESRPGRYYLEVQASGCQWEVVVKGPRDRSVT